MEIRYCSAETKNCMLDAYNGNGVDNTVHRRCLFEYVNTLRRSTLVLILQSTDGLQT
jgi:hypothetical protein